ncbi:MAG: phage tail tape measure protein [Ahrensia sp.]|nr:phage tail tape measure protein [Ahrensia sp.]
MSARAMALDIMVRMRDRFRGPLRGIMSGLDRLSAVARRVGAVGAVVGAVSFAGPAQEAAAFDQTIRDMGVTASMTRDRIEELIQSSAGLYEDIAFDAGQSSVDTAGVAQQLVADGLDKDLADRLLKPIADTATAANAQMSDIGRVAFSLADVLGIEPEGMTSALAKLVVAGKQGRFELREMAKHFPSLTTQAAKFGVVGEEAVAMLASSLQIAMKGAADPSQAANNFRNFLSKALAPDTIKRFKDAGVDIAGVMRDATTRGINPIEALIAKTQDLTGVSSKVVAGYMEEAKARGLEGADALEEVKRQLEGIGAAEKLSTLFGDQQVLDFLLPMLANIEEYKRIKAEVLAADEEVIARDRETQLAGPMRQWAQLRELATQTQRDIGESFNAWLPTLLNGAVQLRDLARELEDAFPGLKQKVLQFGAGAVLLAVGLGALGLVLPAVTAGASALAAAFALAFSWVGVVIALLATGAYAIYRNWDRIGPYFEALWSGVKQIFAQGWTAIKDTFQSGYDLVEGVMKGDIDLFGFTIDDAKLAALETYQGIVAGVTKAWSAVKQLAQGETAILGFTINDASSAALTAYAALLETFSTSWEKMKGIATGEVAIAGFTIDDAKVAALSAFADMWAEINALASGFKSGFGEGLNEFVDRLAGTAGRVQPLTESLSRLGSSLSAIYDAFPTGDALKTARSFGEFVGTLARGGLNQIAATIDTLAANLRLTVEGVTALSQALQGKPINWDALKGAGLDSLKSYREYINTLLGTVSELVGMDLTIDWSALVDGIDDAVAGVKAKINELVEWFKSLPGRIVDAIGSIDLSGLISWPTLPSWLGGGKVKVDGLSDAGKAAANDNASIRDRAANSNQGPGAFDKLLGPQSKASAAPATLVKPVKQDVNVGGQVTIAVNGPGKVTSTSSANQNVPVTPARGRTVGRS